MTRKKIKKEIKKKVNSEELLKKKKYYSHRIDLINEKLGEK